MAETLKEFVVNLKYQQEGSQEFVDGVENTGSAVMRVGSAIATAFTGIALGISKYAQSMEQLDFISIRTRTTVDNLRALQIAGASLGSTAAGMTSSLEGVSRFMRNTPGASAFLATMGVETKDKNGKELDHAQIMKNIGKSFRGMSQPMANLYAQQLGIDENTELAMRDPNFDHNYGVFRAKYGNMDAAAKSANIAVNHGRVAAAGFEDGIAMGADKTLTAFDKLDTMTGGLSTQIGMAVVGLTSLKIATSAVAKLWRAIAPAGAGAEAGAGAGAAAGAGAGAGLAARVLPFAKSASGIGMMIHSPSLNVGEDAKIAKMQADYRKNIGAKATATVGSSSIDDILDGVKWAESRGNPNAIGRRADGKPSGALGAYQLMPKTADYYHVNALDQVASRGAAKKELSRLLKHYKGNQIQALQAYNWGQGNIDAYLKTGYGLHGKSMSGETKNYPGQVEKGMTITQNNNITINGVSDPKAAGVEVRKQLSQLNARNSAGVMR